MTFTHDDIQHHLIAFLYDDELDAAARAAFQAHLTTCGRCRAEVGALAESRATARAVVRAPLDQPVPASVHARVIEAGNRAVSRRPSAGAAASLAAPAQRSPVESAPARWWPRLRGRWTGPMFATVAAMATVLLGREIIFREARRPLEQTPATGLAQPPVQTLPTPGGAGAAPDHPGLQDDDRDKDRQGAGFDHRTLPQGPAHRRGAFATGAKRARAPAKQNLDTGLGQPPPGSEKELSLPESSRVRGPSANIPAEGGPAKGSSRDQLPSGGNAQIADTPRARASAGAVPAPASPIMPMAASAPATAQAPPPPAPRGTTSKAESARSSTVDSKADAPGRGDVMADEAELAAPPDPAIALSARADELMAARRWPDAVPAYRDLLKRFPRHALASAWRSRLAAAQAAIDSHPDGNRFAAPPPPR